MNYRVFQQMPPQSAGPEFTAHIAFRFELDADTPEQALDLARQSAVFSKARGLARSPMVQEAA